MAGAAVINFRIVGDARSAQGAVRQTERSGGGLSKGFGALKGAALAVAGSAAMGAFIAGAKKATEEASNLEQSAGAVEKVFKGSADQVKAFGDTAATAVGMSTSAFDQMAAVSGAMLQNLGFNSKQAADQTQVLAARAADVSAVMGGSATDAMEAFQAALRGEFDPLEWRASEPLRGVGR